MLRNILKYGGSGILIAVGYMDPGNWATDIAAGSHFGYSLLFFILISSMMGMLLQYLSIKLGVATGKDLAQISSQEYNKASRISLWVLAEIGIIACDMAEIIGTAIALYLLFHIPILLGAILTILDTLLILFFVRSNMRYLEAFIVSLMIIISLCFIYNFIEFPPSMSGILHGLLPPIHLATNQEALLIAVGILGATVMPHNLYLHSHIVQDKIVNITNFSAKKQALKFMAWDCNLSLFYAFFINAFILILAANHFYNFKPVDSIIDAYQLLSPLGLTAAGVLFAVALLAAGQNSALTGTLAGQVVMSGFLHLTLSPIKIRLYTRLLALLPVLFCLILFGDKIVDRLLILSQVILSIQLPFAAIPLLLFTNNKKIMGNFVNGKMLSLISWFIVAIILGLNIILVITSF